MKQFSQQLHKKATSTVKLQAAETRELRERLVAYMEYHPLPAEMRSVPVVAPVTAEPYKVVKFPFLTLFKYGAAVAAVVLVAVPFMAKNTVPGDVLYAVKVQFNEEVRSALTFDSFEKVEWETERLNRRIAEARLLASEGRLTEAVEAEVADAVRAHTENAKREIAVLRTEDADEATMASIAFDATLEVQSTSLKDEEATEAGSTTVAFQSVSLIATALDESREPSDAVSASTTPPYSKLVARVEQNTTRVYELRDQLRKTAPPTEIAEVDRRVADIERSVANAVASSADDEVDARRMLVEVLQRTQRLIVFMTEIEVSATVNIEAVVPVVLTDEEKADIRASSTQTVASLIKEINTLTNGVENQAVLEKVTVGQTMLRELAEKMATSTTEFVAFTELYKEFVTMAADVKILLEQYYGPNEPLIIIDDSATSTDIVLATSTEKTAASSTDVVTGVDEAVATGSIDHASSTDAETSVDSNL